MGKKYLEHFKQKKGITGTELLIELLKNSDSTDFDGMPIVRLLPKANGGAIKYIRYDAMVSTLNKLNKQNEKK
jgi:hypothetical protein